MAIQTIFGGAVDRIRLATLDDVQKFEKKKPDKEARQAVRDKSWVVVTRPDGSEFMTHIAKLHADGGLSEITKALGVTGEMTNG